MPGFFVSNMGEVVLNNIYEDRCRKDSLAYGTFFCARNTLDKFLDDKTLFENDNYVVIAEGVLLNKSELLLQAKLRSVADLIIRYYESKGDCFFDSFRGTFSGALFDKRRERWIFYTNHCGTSPLFYFDGKDGSFAIGSQVNYILDALRKEGIAITLNDQAVYAMLTYGFMIDDSTYVTQVKRLLPGRYIVLDSEGFCICEYYRPKKNLFDLSNVSDEDIIEELNERFMHAIRLEFEKDREYGLRHLCDLSGGLDSRMTTWVAHELGYDDCLNLTFCQSGYADEVIAEQIASYLGNELIFKPLDDARFILDPQHIVGMNYGLSLYSGITGGESLLRSLDLKEFGIEHGGDLGDVVVGSYIKLLSANNNISHVGVYSTKLLDKLAPLDSSQYLDREQFMLETRGFLGMLTPHMIRRNYTETSAPFLDVDFLNYCLSIPIEKRRRHILYRRWIKEKHPSAAQFIWEAQGLPVDAAPVKVLFKEALGICNIFKDKLMKRSGAIYKGMNPFDRWYSTHDYIREWMDSVPTMLGSRCPARLREDVQVLFDEGVTLEKTQAITVLAAIDYYLN